MLRFAEIDKLDDQIVALLARRQQWVEQASAYKRDETAVRAPDRRAQMMDRLRRRAVGCGLDPAVVDRVYNAMIDAFIQLELREHRATRPPVRRVEPIDPARAGCTSHGVRPYRCDHGSRAGDHADLGVERG